MSSFSLEKSERATLTALAEIRRFNWAPAISDNVALFLANGGFVAQSQRKCPLTGKMKAWLSITHSGEELLEHLERKYGDENGKND